MFLLVLAAATAALALRMPFLALPLRMRPFALALRSHTLRARRVLPPREFLRMSAGARWRSALFEARPRRTATVYMRPLLRAGAASCHIGVLAPES